ncbi:MAG: flagellar motor protein MotB [Terriglobales bacterium]|jgi:chemotaxis protein MotB
MAPPPIIVIKKKSSHGGHHGGAWKVAYADFVTAMMALFIVLWLMSNSSKQTQIAISGYFKDPSGTGKKVGTVASGTVSGSAENFQLTKQDMGKLKAQLQKSIQNITDLDKLKKNIEMTVTAEGLRIELLESEKGTFFDSGSSALNNSGQELVALLAVELGKLPNHISVEGHTDAKPFTGKGSYSNWELSADRANAARRLMQQAGLRPDQVSQVRGFADQRLRNIKDALDPSNRRISIIVQYVNSGEAVESAVDSRDASAETKLPGVEGKPEGGVENREAK